MTDSNKSSGGNHLINAAQVFVKSSNIGTSRLIDEHYHDKPEEYVRAAYRTGISADLQLPLPGYAKPKIREPKKDKTGRYWENWSNTALPWMSIGYETQVPPISTLAFYNGIANNGKMIRPYMVREIQQDGKTIQLFDTEVIRSKICSDEALRDIRCCLHDVVWDNHLGTASIRPWNKEPKAQSDLVHIAGKTGTAQLFMNGHYSGRNHRMTFVGYFPEEDPQYTCLCMIENPKNAGLYDAGYDYDGDDYGSYDNDWSEDWDDDDWDWGSDYDFDYDWDSGSDWDWDSGSDWDSDW